MSNSNMVMGQAAAANNPQLSKPWDLSYAYYDPPEGLAWNLATAVYSGNSFSVAAQEGSPEDLFFKPDGTKMYIIGIAGDEVNEYDLSTAWDVSTASFLRFLSISAQDGGAQGLFFRSDGLKMYIVGNANDNVYEYNLSTAWDVSSASFLQSFSVAAQETTPQAVFFKFDGLKMYVLGLLGDSVKEYNLSTAWDVSSAVYLQNFGVGAQNSTPTGLFFKSDGLKMYIVGNSGTSDFVYEYNLSTAWDVSSAVYLQNFSVAGQDLIPNGIYIKPDGTAFYVTGRTNNTVYQYTLGGFSVAAQESNPTGLFVRSDGLKMYVVGSGGDEVNEYDLSTAWDVSTATFLQLFSVAAQDTVPTGIFFKPDGTKMYISGNTGDDVNEYDLSTAWDVSSATFIQSFSVAGQEATPEGLFFKPDGTKMYVLGSATDSIYEYNLSTAWSVSTASFLRSLSISDQELAPTDVFFKPDGTKMYFSGGAGDDVNEYDLSTAWDISAATFLQNFKVRPQAFTISGVFFRDDGTQMFITGQVQDSVFSYTLGVQP
jgi:DNA-binding beta-propeller fold protein YncE